MAYQDSLTMRLQVFSKTSPCFLTSNYVPGEEGSDGLRSYFENLKSSEQQVDELINDSIFSKFRHRQTFLRGGVVNERIRIPIAYQVLLLDPNSTVLDYHTGEFDQTKIDDSQWSKYKEKFLETFDPLIRPTGW